jgi:hypothetical protein
MSAEKNRGYLRNVCYVAIGLFAAICAFALLKPNAFWSPATFESYSVCPTGLTAKKPGGLCVDILKGEVEITRKDGVSLVIRSDAVRH